MHSSTCGKNNTDGWNLDQGLAAQYAAQAGLDPDLAADAGEEVWDVLKSLRDATGETDPKRQAKLVKRTKARLSKANLSRYGELVQHIEARLLALQGRGGDTELAHLTPGEVIVPPQLQTPEVVQAIQQAAQNAGIDMARYTAGSQASSVNPETGMAEYAIQSNLSCGDLTPMGLCLDPYFEEITVTGVGGSDGSFYPGQNSYDGSGLSGNAGGIGGGGGGGPYGPDPVDEDPIEEIVVTPDGNSIDRPNLWDMNDLVQIADAGGNGYRRYNPFEWDPYSPHLGEPALAPPKVPWDDVPEDFSKFSDSDVVNRIRRIDGTIAQNKIVERTPLGKFWNKVLKPDAGLDLNRLNAVRDAHVAECAARSSCNYQHIFDDSK